MGSRATAVSLFAYQAQKLDIDALEEGIQDPAALSTQDGFSIRTMQAAIASCREGAGIKRGT